MNEDRPEAKVRGRNPLLAAAAAASVLGIVGFVYLFLRHLTVYWIILSPVIFVIYQLPAVVLFSIAKRRK